MERKGICIWFTGLPSAGKTTLAGRLAQELEAAGRTVTVLDGDAVRTHLSKGLGYSREDRDTNVLRIGWVAAQIVHHGGVVLCAMVSPYEETRQRVRTLFQPGEFVLVHVDPPLAVCEKRDVKGLYAKARAGEIRGFTGVDDPYERPANPEFHIDTSGGSVESDVRQLLEFLGQREKIPVLT